MDVRNKPDYKALQLSHPFVSTCMLASKEQSLHARAVSFTEDSLVIYRHLAFVLTSAESMPGRSA